METPSLVKKRRSVALLVETSNAYSRGLLEGVLDYVKQHSNWSMFVNEQERGAAPPKWLNHWQGDGLIARIETDNIATAIKKIGLPVVDLSAARHLPGIPWADTDDRAIAQLAIEHFVERGFKHLAYCGDPAFQWSQTRAQSFAKIIAEENQTHGDLTFHAYQSIARYDSKFTLDREKKRIANWLTQLPRPVAIMGCYDYKAQQVLDVCRELEIAVPEEIAVLGVDNDHLLCEFASPPLSSIIPDTRRTGFEAAELLDRMMSGESVSTSPLITKPLGIHTRESTDILAIDDQEIAVALKYIREHANHNIRVSDVLKSVPMSRRVFESRFQKVVGRSPHSEIQRVRTNRIKQLLTETTLSIHDIAELCGFEHAEYMAAVFKRDFDVSPSDFRKRVNRT
ncbi:MAG: LacI family transcriptional regulator [Mariniblastus sp.]|jgi:LacI family transcriptional regulator